MPYTTLVAGTTIASAWANANVRDQVVTPFTTKAARNSAITAPIQGMLTAITDDDVIEVYNGTAWIELYRWAGIPATQEAAVLTSQTTTSGSYVDLATVGPSVTMTPPPSGKVLVTVTGSKSTDGTLNQTASMAFDLSGGNTLAANDNRSNNVNQGTNASGIAVAASASFLLTALAVASTTFTAKYRSSGGAVATFTNRRLIVEPVLV